MLLYIRNFSCEKIFIITNCNMFGIGHEMAENKSVVFTTLQSGYSRMRQDAYASRLRKLRLEFFDLYNSKTQCTAALKDFEVGRIIGTGAFGVVYLSKHMSSGRYFALKVLEKEKLVKLKQVQHTYNEKRILNSTNFPFLVYMKYCFKDNIYIYFALPFVTGGEMFTHLRKRGKFDEKTAVFYAGQVILALEYLHACDLLYRDLKPENIMIDRTGYIKITDFGFCKVVRGRTWTLCGTPEYLAPEIILSKGYGMSVDWWSLGVFIFEMCAGFPPFYAPDPMRIYEKIVGGKYKCPSNFTKELKDLIGHVLNTDVTRRYGNLRNGVLDFKNHKWFMELDWDGLLVYKVVPPFMPRVQSPGDASNFDSYQLVKLKTSPVCLYEQQFENF